MLPFALLVLVFLLLMFRFLGGAGGAQADRGRPQVQCVEGTVAVHIAEGQTCWEIAEAHGVGVEELLQLKGNEGLDCDKLAIGQGICVPE
jgi:hypothetical protein